MTTDGVSMNFEEMAEALRVFSDCANALEDLSSQVKGWSTILNEGAMLGDAGEALSDALSTALCSAIQKLGDKMMEEAQTVRESVETLRADMSETAGYFG